MLRYGWQTDPDLWAQISADLSTSTSWRFVDFVEAEAASIPKHESGIYFVCTCPAGVRPLGKIRKNDLFSRLFTPIYIGKTDDLKRRFLEHCRRPSPGVEAARHCFGPALQFWFHRLSLDRIGDEEARLIQCFGPTANERQERVRGTIRDGISVGIQSYGGN